MNKPLNHFYEFGEFRIDATERILLRHGVPVPLPPKVFDTLLALVERNGHIVGKEQLIRTVWPDTFIEENNLSQCISASRKALGDDRHEPRFIETVSRRGYRFRGEVRELWNDTEEVVSVSQTKISLRVSEEIEGGALAPSAAFARQQVAASRKTVVATVALVLLVGGLVAASRIRPTTKVTAAIPPIKTIAVLPLKVAGHDDPFLGLAVADDLTMRLDHMLDITVRPASSVYRYAGVPTDPVTAANALKVDAVFEGELQKNGDRLDLALRLIDANDGQTIWKFSADAASPAARNAITEKAGREVFAAPASALKAVLSKHRTANLAAHESYVRGRYYWSQRTAESLHQSIAALEKAVTHDPHYALAYAALADAYAFDYINWSRAEATARKALELDNSLGQAHATIGFVRWFWLWDWAEADRALKLAIALSPDYATARQWYGCYLASRYYLREAKAEMTRALQLEPLSPSINADLAQVLYFTRDYDAAIQQGQETLKLDPNFANAHIYLFQAFTLKGAYDDAIGEYFKAQQIVNSDAVLFQAQEKNLRAAYAAQGMRGFWREKLKENSRYPERITDPYQRAEYHALLGEKDQAISMLSDAIKRRDPPAVFSRVNPMFKELFEDPRFLALMEQLDRSAQMKS